MSNAKKGPKTSFNVYKEFSDVELDAQIIVATMTHFDMKDINGKFFLLDKQKRSDLPTAKTNSHYNLYFNI